MENHQWITKYAEQKRRYLKLKNRYFNLLGSGVDRQEITIRVLEFNIENGGTVISFDKVVEAIIAAKPDIVAIEEAWGNLPKLAKRIGFPYYDVRTQVISRFPIIDPSDANGRYVFIEVLSNLVIAVSNVHLPSELYGPVVLHHHATFKRLSTIENELRMHALEDELEVLPGLVKADIPVFLVGDFNDPSYLDCKKGEVDCFPWPISKKLARMGFRDSYREFYPDPNINPGFTWWANRPKVSGWNPSHFERQDRIDFIYAAGPSKVLRSTVIGEVLNKDVSIAITPWPSDHRAVLSEFSVIPAKMPEFISVNRRVIELGDKIEIRYNVPDKSAKQVAIKSVDNDEFIFRKNSDGGDNKVSVKMAKSIGSFEAVLIGSNGKIKKQTPFFVKPKNGKIMLTTDKKTYKQGEPIIVKWLYAPGNRFDWIVIRNINDEINEDNVMGHHTDAQIKGSTSFEKNNVRKWPLALGKYQVLYMINDSFNIMAKSGFSIT